MHLINFRGPYAFVPGRFAGGGDLPGALERVMQKQSLQQQGADLGSTSTGVSEYDPSSHGSPQGGLLGRLLTMQAEQERYQSDPEETRSTSVTPRDSNFRQLSRISAAGMSPVVDPSRPGNAPSERMPRAVGSSFPLHEGASSVGRGLLDTSDDIAPSISVGWRPRGNSIGTFPSGPASAPPSPMPMVPDWWIAAGKIGQLLLRGMYGNPGDGRGAYGRCIRASSGSVDDWEDFCKFLGRGENNTVGGESQNKACWGKTFLSENEKRNWCENQFGNR